MKSLIEIQEEVQIGEVILEKGDRIKILESRIPVEYIKRGVVRVKPNNSPSTQAYKSYNLEPDDLIGWFANQYNMAFGWSIYKASNSDKQEFGYDVFRTYSEKTDSTSIIKINLLKGTYAFIDNQVYENEYKVQFDKMSPYNRIYIEPTEKAYEEFGIV